MLKISSFQLVLVSSEEREFRIHRHRDSFLERVLIRRSKKTPMSRQDEVKFPNRCIGLMCLSACLALSEEKSTQHFVAKADSAGGGVLCWVTKQTPF